MIEEFIDSALIIDDKEDEIKMLRTLLHEKDILVNYYHPKNLRDIKLKTRKIIFLDLSLDDSKSEIDNISTIIRPILEKNLGPNFGTYGIVLWTKHISWVGEFQNKIQFDLGKYTLPLFIVGLDKSAYIRAGNFNSVLEDLNRLLDDNNAARFFIQWFTLIDKGRDNAIKDIYSLIKDYDKQNANLQFILFRMAQNYSGIPLTDIRDYPLHIDAFKTFNEMMSYEVVSIKQTESKIFKELTNVKFISQNKDYSKDVFGNYFYQDNQISTRLTRTPTNHKNIKDLDDETAIIYSKINNKLLLDSKNLNQNIIFPGNIYKIIDTKSIYRIENLSSDFEPIIIEMTPPCDYSQGKMINSKVLGGFITKYSPDKIEKFKKEYFYKYIWPIEILGFENPSMIIFDFRYTGSLEKSDLYDANKYKLILRAKDNVFADVLQKLSSHIARLGLGIIQ